MKGAEGAGPERVPVGDAVLVVGGLGEVDVTPVFRLRRDVTEQAVHRHMAS